MASTSSIPPYNDLSLCVYIGNTTSIGDDILLNYCSQFGTIVTSSFGKAKFCDFRILEFAHYEHLERFLRASHHQIERTRLDVKLYKHILTNNDLLNLDRKCFLGPIVNRNNIQTIVQYYRILDPTLQYSSSTQEGQEYLLFEFSNRPSISAVLENQTTPVTIEHSQFSIYKPYHPRQLVTRIISMKNKANQIHVHHLTANITSEILVDYFHKRAPVIACQIVFNRPRGAVLEFSDERTVRKILESPDVRLQGATLRLSNASRHLVSLLSSATGDGKCDDDVDDNNKQSQSLMTSRTPNQSPLAIPRSSQQQPPPPFVIPSPSISTTEVLYASPPVLSQPGWSSPPRSIITQRPSMDTPSVRLSPKPCATPTPVTVDATSHPTPCDVDIKPIRKVSSNNLLRFVEQFQTELDQVKGDYVLKFAKDRTYIEQEINLLVNEERRTFDSLNRYLNDRRKRVEKRNGHKRKNSSSSSAE